MPFFPDKLKTSTLDRNADGFWKIGPSAGPICEACGAYDECKIRRHIQHTPGREQVHLTINGCRAFRPIIGFAALNGLDLPEWNTFRIGSAWHDRLRPNDSVAVADMPARRIVRTMFVKATHVGPLSELLEAHAHENHSMRWLVMNAMVVNGESPAVKLGRNLRNHYGSYVTPQKTFTVIELQEGPCPI